MEEKFALENILLMDILHYYHMMIVLIYLIRSHPIVMHINIKNLQISLFNSTDHIGMDIQIYLNPRTFIHKLKRHMVSYMREHSKSQKHY